MSRVSGRTMKLLRGAACRTPRRHRVTQVRNNSLRNNDVTEAQGKLRTECLAREEVLAK